MFMAIKNNLQNQINTNIFGGVLLSVTIAGAAVFLSEHYGAPAMLFALLLGMAFNFLATEEKCQEGVQFAATTLLRCGVALLGLRISLSDMMELGAMPVLGVVGLVVMTIAIGSLTARLFGQSWYLGVLTSGAVAICGASAALAITAMLPKDKILERDTLFTVVGVTTLSTVAMIAYPILFSAMGMQNAEVGFLIGATIHDVAQVVGAGYSVSDETGDIATFVKLQRVALLPVVLICLSFAMRVTNKGADGSVKLPLFVIAFIVLVLVSSFHLVPTSVTEAASSLSRWMLVTAISALGIKTSLKAMMDVGVRHALIIVLQTLFLLGAALAFVTWAL